MLKDISASLLLSYFFSCIGMESQVESEPCLISPEPYPFDLGPGPLPVPMVKDDSLGPIQLPVPRVKDDSIFLSQPASADLFLMYFPLAFFSFVVLLAFSYCVKRLYFTKAKDEPELHLAIQRDDLARTRLLLDNGADIDEVDSQGNTALHEAANSRATDIVSLLLSRGASSINQANNEGDSPLHINLWYPNIDITRLLLNHGADITQRNRQGKTPLTQMDSKGRNPLHWAVKESDAEVLGFLLDQGMAINQVDHAGDTVLHWATYYQKSHIVEILVNRGAAVNQANNKGITPLHNAVSPKNLDNGIDLDIVELLLNRGAAVNQVDNMGVTPLHNAVSTGSPEYDGGSDLAVIELLLNRGAEINQADNEGYTPLHEAVLRGDLPTIELLLNHGADINQMNYRGETAITQVDCKGNTPLHDWVAKNVDVVRFLLNNGADPTQKNDDGQTPFDLLPAEWSDIKRPFVAKFLWDKWQSFKGKNLDLNQPNNNSPHAATNGRARKKADHCDGPYYSNDTRYRPTFYHQWLSAEVLEGVLGLLPPPPQSPSQR